MIGCGWAWADILVAMFADLKDSRLSKSCPFFMLRESRYDLVVIPGCGALVNLLPIGPGALADILIDETDWAETAILAYLVPTKELVAWVGPLTAKVF